MKYAFIRGYRGVVTKRLIFNAMVMDSISTLHFFQYSAGRQNAAMSYVIQDSHISLSLPTLCRIQREMNFLGCEYDRISILSLHTRTIIMLLIKNTFLSVE